MTFEQYYNSTLQRNISKARSRAKERDDRFYDYWVASKSDEPCFVPEYTESNLPANPEPMTREIFESEEHNLMVGLGNQNLISDANLTIVIDFDEFGESGRLVIKERAWDTVDVYWREGDNNIQSVRLHDKPIGYRRAGWAKVRKYDHQSRQINICGYRFLVSGLGLKSFIKA
jgi:hypothetical protein